MLVSVQTNHAIEHSCHISVCSNQNQRVQQIISQNETNSNLTDGGVKI